MIGLLFRQAHELSFLKETIEKFPYFDYAVYIDENGNETEALKWFEGKEAIVVASQREKDSYLIPVISFSQLHAYLETQTPKEGQGSRREIYTTQNSKEQDAAIAEALGGFFVAPQ